MKGRAQVNIPVATFAPIIEEQLSMEKAVRFAPKGTSMLPMIREGRDTVTLSAIQRPLKKYDIGFYRRENGQYVLHRIIKAEDTLTCIGDGQFVYETGLSPSQFIGVVSEFSRGAKTYSVDSRVYKLYCRLWHYSRPFRHLFRRVAHKIKRILKGKT